MIASKVQLVEQLKGLHDETERIYEKEIMNLAMIGQKTSFEQWAQLVLDLPDDAPVSNVKDLLEHTGLGRENHFDNWVDELMTRSESEDPEEEKVTFAAFCIRIGQFRRNQDRTRENELMTQYRERFDCHPFFNHLLLMSMLDQDPVSRSKRVLELADDNTRTMPSNAGVHHALAIAVADIFEATELTPELRPDAKWLQRGIEASQEALELDPKYPKFHCTAGRLLALQGKHKEALKEISVAIDTENSKQSDYALRIGSYRMYYQRIQEKRHSVAMGREVQKQLDTAQELMGQMETSMKEMESKQALLEEDTRSSLTKNMEFLGLFAGIVSFTIGGVSIAGAMADRSLVGAAGLIVVLMGALLGVFAGFGIILHGYRGEKSRRNLLVFALGAVITAAGVFLCFL